MTTFSDHEVGQHRLECTACGRGVKDKTLSVKIEADGSGVAHCFRCGYTESHHPDRGAVRRTPTVKPAIKPAIQQHKGLSDWGRELWAGTQELSGVAVKYLAARHCCLPPLYGDLRWHPALKHPSGYVGAALVALITDVHSNEPLSLHRTWITATGKADIDTPRLLLAHHSILNGCIRLTPNDEVNAVLGIAEGIETALSLAWAPLPVWATIDAGHMSKFPVLKGISTLVIARDKDPAGIAAATTCAARWVSAGTEVIVTNQSKNDLNDEVMEAANV